ncbi:MAG: cyclic nucleotide-binding domain-containing protein [Oscillatoriales cyanobacterium RM1_1_9]|nr:cyclic nucleotide-binding domain-containing protein [Oscillatoriales cyanobacterium SM2_3_0]NJO47756.1 cyclic nucleotide-binding domain-containing protein [Oscillatoriales cyanobacterium RM2_1_1]NJO70777.1 cyclic nucleotide-binding domain-containing protein [Oscillatoriales cyanobacterium RM1_1_9]
MKNILSHLAALQTSDIDWMTANGQILNLSEDQILVEANTKLDVLYILLEGNLVIQTPPTPVHTQGEELTQLFPGELIGELCFIDHKLAVTTVKALSPSQVIVLPKWALMEKLGTDPDFATGFYQTLAMHLSGKLRALSDLLARNRTASSPSLQKVLFVFAILNDSDLDWMITCGTRQVVKTEARIIEAGMVVESISILLEGTLGIFIPTTVEGKSLELAIAKSVPGEILGEMSFIETKRASAMVKALEDCLLLTIPQKLLLERMQQNPGFCIRFYRAISTILADRLRTQLRSYQSGQTSLESNVNPSGHHQELDLAVLETMAIAGTRFDWMFKRLIS